MCFLKSGNGFGFQVNNRGYLGHKLSKGNNVHFIFFHTSFLNSSFSVCNGNDGAGLQSGSSNGPDDGEGNEAGNGSETAQSNTEGVTTAGGTEANTEANTESNTEGITEGNIEGGEGGDDTAAGRTGSGAGGTFVNIGCIMFVMFVRMASALKM